MVTSILQGSHKASLDDEVPLQLAPADVRRLISEHTPLLFATLRAIWEWRGRDVEVA